jgi:hypothetical protein
MNLLRFFAPLQEVFDKLAGSLALLLRQILRSILEYRSLILDRSPLNLAQSKSEMRTDNFIIILFIVPVLITSDITSRLWVVTWKLETGVRNRL